MISYEGTRIRAQAPFSMHVLGLILTRIFFSLDGDLSNGRGGTPFPLSYQGLTTRVGCPVPHSARGFILMRWRRVTIVNTAAVHVAKQRSHSREFSCPADMKALNVDTLPP